jgi:DNA polymerase-1
LKRIVCTNYADAIKVIESEDWSVTAFDTETNQLKWYGQRIQGASFCNGRVNIYLDIAREPELERAIKAIFDRVVLVVAHNIVFDAKALFNSGIDIRDKLWYDTWVAEHLLDESSHKIGLKDLAQKYFNAETVDYEEAQKAGIHSQKFYDYALNDTEWTWKLFLLQKWKLEEEGLVDLMRELEGPFLKVIMEMEMNGFQVDQKRLQRTTKKLEKDLPELQEEILKLLGEKYEKQRDLFGEYTIIADFNPGSAHHLRKKLVEELKLPLTELTDGGAISVSAPSLLPFKNAHPVIPPLMKYKNALKLKTAFFDPLPKLIDPDGRVRPHFNDAGTKTGRLSCTGPNLQQLSKESKDAYGLRKCFIAPEGKSILTCDYSGQEIRIMAHISQDPTIIEALKLGKDLHLTTAKQFFNLDIPDEALYETSELYKEYKDKHKKEREKAKTILFGLAYGKGAFGFAKDFKITEEEAQKIVDRFFDQFPKVKEAINKARNTIIQQGYVTSMTGRKRRFRTNENGYYSNAAFREGFNFLIQGAAADMIRMASIRVAKLPQQHPEWELKIVATVHDENVYEVKTEYLEAASDAVKREFESVLPGFSVPIVSSIGVGADYNSAK